MYSMFGGNAYYAAMIQHFSLTFFLFLILQGNFYPLWLHHQTSATKLCYLWSSTFYRQPSLCIMHVYILGLTVQIR